MLRWLRSLSAWRTVHDTGAWLYQENAITGRRRVLRGQEGGHQPRMKEWELGGSWEEINVPEPIFIGGSAAIPPPPKVIHVYHHTA